MANGEVDKKKGGSEKGRPKHRSPNYPLFDLGKAVEQTKKLHATDKTQKVPIGVVHDRWGYKRHSAAGNQAVAAVKSYGLISVEGAGEQRMIAVTDVGRRIALESPDRPELLKKAAVGPSLFDSLWGQYSETGMPSDDVLRHHLIFDRNFNEDVVDNVIERFKATVAYAGLVAGDKIHGEGGREEEEEDNGGESGESAPPPDPRRKRRQQMQPGIKEDVFSLDEGAVVLQWPERLSKASAEDLQDWLELIGRKIRRAASSAASDAPSDDLDN